MDGALPSFQPSLLLLADSALPLGSFAFSNGLESYLAHHARSQSSNTFAKSTTSPGSNSAAQAHTLIPSFLSLSLLSISSSTLPYLTAAYKDPSQLRTLDNDLDASTPCTVARRASIAQGRALIGVWEKAFKHAHDDPTTINHSQPNETLANDASLTARNHLTAFSSALKGPLSASVGTTTRPGANGHLPPLFALVCLSEGLSLTDTIWIFLFNHARAVLSAAVRAGVLGPYQSQAMLASAWLRDLLGQCVERAARTSVIEAGQCVPLIDVWSGRHELLYTRIFNS